MLIAIISDIHANQLALEACLAQCAGLGASQLVFLGDVVGYGPDPEAVTSRLSELMAMGALAILGNHDEAVFTPSMRMNEIATRAIAWTRTRLSDQSQRFLKSLPLTATLGDVLLVHADASEPGRWNYVTDGEAARRSLAATGARVTICGHVHVPQLYCMTATAKVVAHVPITSVPVILSEQRQWLAVAGACGQPRDGNPAAAFVTYDTSTRELIYRRAPYDAEAAAQRVRAAGLPEQLAKRLITGT